MPPGLGSYCADHERTEQLIVLVNRSAEPLNAITIALAALPNAAAAPFRDLLTGASYNPDSDRLRLGIDAKGCLLLHRTTA